MNRLYFDYNATTPVAPEVFEAMRPYFVERFGNPGCGHIYGLEAKEAMDRARDQVAALIGAHSGNIVFTSCATESNNLVLLGSFGSVGSRGISAGDPVDPDGRTDRPGDSGGAELIVSAIEHPAVLEPAKLLEARGVRVVRVPVDSRGVVDPEAVARAVGSATRLVSVMLANNETGALQPVAEIARLARQANPGVLVHTDAAQAVGKIPVDVTALGVDLLTIAGHKLYAPKGVGALYVGPSVSLAPVFGGGGQEGGIRPGTENIPYMVGLGQACGLAGRDLEEVGRRQRELGENFLQGLHGLGDVMGTGKGACPEAGAGAGTGTRTGAGMAFRLHSEGAKRLPQTMSIGFRGYAAGDILSGLVGLDVAVSGGAACHAGEVKVSHVLTAMAVPADYAMGTIRFSWGRSTTREDVLELVRRLRAVFETLPRP